MSYVARTRNVPAGGVSPVRRLSRTVTIAGVWAILATLALSALYPLVLLTLASFRTEEDYARNPIGLPKQWTLDNVTRAFGEADMGRYALNSLVVVLVAVAVVTVISCLAAYALTQFEFPLRRTTLVIVVATIALPPTVLMIPIFKFVLELGLLNTRLGLVLVFASLSLPFSIYLLASFMRSIPRELLNAARIDGAGTMRVLWSVVLPLVRPGVLTLVTLNFLNLWNELLFALIIVQNEEQRLLIVGITQYEGQYVSETGLVSVGLLLSMIPPLLIFALFQRDLARGLTAGAVK
jgi:ABC-type glycerol-3-phosphate transport system permease component